MALNTQAIGKDYQPVTYAVGREKIREYAFAVGETNPLHHDLESARSAGYADLVAPPMFVVVYAARSVGPAVLDPDVGINLAMMVHGGQEFRWGPLVIAGDELLLYTPMLALLPPPDALAVTLFITGEEVSLYTP